MLFYFYFNLKKQLARMSEQMLSGIPEVDLGVEERIRNIEETERAKQTNKAKSHKAIAGLTNNNSNNTAVNNSATVGGQSIQVNFVQHKVFWNLFLFKYVGGRMLIDFMDMFVYQSEPDQQHIPIRLW